MKTRRRAAGGGAAGTAAHPLTPERWADLEALFGPRGAYGGCWCMWWRSSRTEFETNKGERNRWALQARVAGGEVPGILLYRDAAPVGWCSVAPRESYPAIVRSPVLRPVDDTPVWSLPCLFVARGERGEGLALALVEAAVEHARAAGAEAVEAYPTVPRGRELPPVSSFMGVPSLFARAGFVEVARPSPARMIMRRRLRSAEEAALLRDVAIAERQIAAGEVIPHHRVRRQVLARIRK